MVTGAGSGIGRALCERLSAHGEAVVAVDIDPGRLDDVVAATSVVPCAADVATEEGNAAMVELALGRFGRLDAVALNAGIDLFGMVEALPMDRFDRAISVNLRSALLGIRAALPALRQGGGGAIVVTSSIGGLMGQVGRSAYGVAKAGLINLVKSVALEVGHENIRVNAVCPGPIRDTGLSAGFDTRNPEAFKQFANRTALKRFGTAGEVAAVMDFLLSSEASYVTGAVVAVDGGTSAGEALDQPLGNM